MVATVPGAITIVAGLNKAGQAEAGGRRGLSHAGFLRLLIYNQIKLRHLYTQPLQTFYREIEPLHAVG